MLIGITGATGAIGGGVARRLLETGADVRLIVRDAGRLDGDLAGADTFEVPGGYGDHDGLTAALEAVDALLLVSGAESADRMHEHTLAVRALADARVGHVVYTSFLGAAPDATFTLARDHDATERLIRDTGVPFTFLRDSLYAEILPLVAGEDGVIRGPAGEGRIAPVSRGDVVACAAAVLADPVAHAGRTYTLTGPVARTLTEMAAVLTELTGRTYTYVDETVEEAYASRAVYEAPQWQLDAWVSTYTAVARGEMDVVSGDVEALTGAPPLDLGEVFLSEA